MTARFLLPTRDQSAAPTFSAFVPDYMLDFLFQEPLIDNLANSPARAGPSPTDPVDLRPFGSPVHAAAGAAPDAQFAGAAGVQGAVGTVSTGVAQSAFYDGFDDIYTPPQADQADTEDTSALPSDRAKRKRHHHDPPEVMTAEEAEEFLHAFRSWVLKAQAYLPGDGPTRCCARVHADCLKAEGKKAGGSMTATFRTGVRDGWQLCNWCYPPFNKARHHARQALELHGQLAPLFADLFQYLDR